ncbi:MAG: polysaccharide pyruvyl transferase family protein [Alphaproteobacteria bacterium]
MKPRVINYQVNDVCDARCVMCNIWMRERGPELTPGQFARMLSDDLFTEVKVLDIANGEPTLKEDLDRYYEAALDALPNLREGRFITNGFSSSRALPMLAKVHAAYAAKGVSFSGMVSIDGIGAVHDRVRGREDAFARATETLFGLRDAGIPVIASCTIVKENVYGLHDLLDWGAENNIHVRFRVAEHIDRLYVDSSNAQIRSFDVQETKHLVAFYHYLIHFYETSEEIRRTYHSILSLLTGDIRLVGCPYQNATAINIDCEGRFAHCAPRGAPHPLGHNPSLDLMRYEHERAEIVEKHCPSCIHDYHAEWSIPETGKRNRAEQARPALYGRPIALESMAETPHAEAAPGSLTHIILAGWYGTETAGDIAILAGIVGQYADRHPAARFTLLSLFPRYTALTIHDLPDGLAKRISVVDYVSEEAKFAADEAGALIMAGGPLMDIPQTEMIASLFSYFAARGRPRIVEGCGIGPLNVEQYKNNVIAIARLATQISVRDHDSAARLRGWGISKPIGVRDDPARDYVRGLGIRWQGKDSKVIRCFLRELTSEYPQAVTSAQAEDITAAFLQRLLEQYPDHAIELLAMHYFPIGNDDRVFARRLAKRIGSDRIAVPMEPMSPSEIIERMSTAAFCVSMRFHSVVFAHTIGAPFIAVDYTAGGKISGFLRDAGTEDRCFDFQSLEKISMERIGALTSMPGTVAGAAP